MTDTIRIAMWSGPRNISTALMRSFGSRDDTAVTDEPLYAAYLVASGAQHPARDEILASQEHGAHDVLDQLHGPAPDGASIWYQKHMAQHLLPTIDRGRLEGFRHAFLIRDPAAVIPSYAKVIDSPTAEDLGYPQQRELFEAEQARTGQAPPVIDSRDVLDDPPGMLEAICEALDIEFDASMLGWSPGPRDTDGVWAPHWYANVERSTGFGRPRDNFDPIPPELEPVHQTCREHYEFLHAHRIGQ